MAQSAKLSRVHAQRLREFMAFTEASQEVALQYMREYEWNLEVATDAYFNAPPPVAEASQNAFDPDAVMSLFELYKAPDEEHIAEEGLSNLFTAMNEDLLGVSPYLFAWKCQSKSLGIIKAPEFLEGMRKLRANSLDELANTLALSRKKVQEDENELRELYEWLWSYVRQGEKFMDMNVAIEVWNTVLNGHFKLLDKWCQFIREKYKRGISKDNWFQLIEFMKLESLDHYDPAEAWPVLIDDFVQWIRNESAA